MKTEGLTGTGHALTRMAQRAIREDDLALILWVGTEVEGGYLVRAKDCQSVERQLKRLAHRVRRLQGKRVVVAGNRIVTVYHTCSATERRLLRGTEEHMLADGKRQWKKRLDLRRFSGEALGQPAACFSNCAGLEKSRAEWRRTGL